MRSYASASNGSLLSAWSARPRISGRSTDTDVQHELRVKDHRIGLRHTYGASLDCHPFDRCAAGFGRRRCLLNCDRRVHGHIKSAVVALEYGRAGGHLRRRSRLCLPFPRESPWLKLRYSRPATPPPAPSTLLCSGTRWLVTLTIKASVGVFKLANGGLNRHRAEVAFRAILTLCGD